MVNVRADDHRGQPRSLLRRRGRKIGFGAEDCVSCNPGARRAPSRALGWVAPDVARASEAGRDGVEFLAVGPHHAGDGESVDDSWVD